MEIILAVFSAAWGQFRYDWVPTEALQHQALIRIQTAARPSPSNKPACLEPGQMRRQ
jgi:hypothetical protein